MLWSVAGVPAGYTAARLYRQMHGQRAYVLIGLTIALFPGLMFTAFFGLDAVLWAQDLHHSRHCPRSAFIRLLVLLPS